MGKIVDGASKFSHKGRGSSSGNGGDDGMNITRSELNTKCEVIEARMDARVQQIETVFTHTSLQNEELKKEFRQAKWWAIGTALAVIGIILTVMALINSWQQTYLSAYSSKHR